MWNNNNGHIYLLGDGDCKRQPVLDYDVCLAVHNCVQMEETRGQIFELGGSHTYTYRELMEFLANTLNHRPKYIRLKYNDFMKMSLAPNSHFEVIFNVMFKKIFRKQFIGSLRDRTI